MTSAAAAAAAVLVMIKMTEDVAADNVDIRRRLTIFSITCVVVIIQSPSAYVNNTKGVNSVFHPSGVSKSSRRTDLPC